jgi:hypothetical protein
VKVGPALKRLHAAELDLAADFRKLGERHAADHDVYHQTRTFAKQCEQHGERLRPIADRYGEELGDAGDGEGLWESVLEAVRRRSSEALGRRPESGLLLLRDLRELYLATQETLITWVIVRQGAMAARDAQLLEVAKELQPETDLQMKWALTHIKVSSPQVLMS